MRVSTAAPAAMRQTAKPKGENPRSGSMARKP